MIGKMSSLFSSPDLYAAEREVHLTKTQRQGGFKTPTLLIGLTNQQATRTRFCSGAAN
jgi:hypothetical protein